MLLGMELKKHSQQLFVPLIFKNMARKRNKEASAHLGLSLRSLKVILWIIFLSLPGTIKSIIYLIPLIFPCEPYPIEPMVFYIPFQKRPGCFSIQLFQSVPKSRYRFQGGYKQ